MFVAFSSDKHAKGSTVTELALIFFINLSFPSDDRAKGSTVQSFRNGQD